MYCIRTYYIQPDVLDICTENNLLFQRLKQITTLVVGRDDFVRYAVFCYCGLENFFYEFKIVNENERNRTNFRMLINLINIRVVGMTCAFEA